MRKLDIEKWPTRVCHQPGLHAYRRFERSGGQCTAGSRMGVRHRAIDGIAAAKSVTNSAIAWLLHHTAKMQPILGTTNPQRVRDVAHAADVEMTREEWYALYLAAGNQLP